MTVSYNAGGLDHDSYAEAASTGFDVWLALDGEPVLPLPHSFDRRVIVGGSEIESHVINCREFIGTTPLRPYAGVLTIDIENEEIEWTPPTPA